MEQRLATMKINLYDRVAQAFILYYESLLGYPEHLFIAIGMLANTSEELLRKGEKFAAEQVREIRIDMGLNTATIDDIPDSFIKVELDVAPIIRKECSECCIKHLAQAYVCHSNNKPSFVIGHLLEAYAESPDNETAREFILEVLESKENITGIPAICEYINTLEEK